MKKENFSSMFSRWKTEFEYSFLESESLCVAIFSLDGTLIFANKAMQSLFKGVPFQSLINPSFSELSEMQCQNSEIYKGFLTIGNYSSDNTSIKSRIFKKEGEILIIGSADTNQLVEQNITMVHLNHQINNLQRALIKEKFELKEANAAKDRFFSIIAHDLKNPFAVLIGFTDIILENLRESDIDTIEEQLKIIGNTTHQTYNLLEDLLLWSKSQSGRLSFKPEIIEFKDTCNEVVINLLSQAGKKHISIEMEGLDEIIVFADMNMLKTILRNLISNAVKFTNVNGKIIINAEKTPDNAIITVSDNGVGIDVKSQAKLWSLSDQYSTPGTKNETGTGLGLILCKEFTERNGGKIWVESEPGRGSDFKFTLPLGTNEDKK